MLLKVARADFEFLEYRDEKQKFAKKIETLTNTQNEIQGMLLSVIHLALVFYKNDNNSTPEIEGLTFILLPHSQLV